MVEPTQLKKYACKIGSFPHGIGVKIPRTSRLGLARCRRGRRTIWQNQNKSSKSTQKDCRKVVEILDCLLVKQLKCTKSGYRNSWDGQKVSETFCNSHLLQVVTSVWNQEVTFAKGLKWLCGTFQWSSFSVVGPWADRYKWSDFTPISVLINGFSWNYFISPLYMNFVTLLSTGFWLHPCSGYTLPNYHRSIQSRGLHLPAPRAPEATWDDWTQDLSRSLADKKWGSLQFSGYQQKKPLHKTKES